MPRQTKRKTEADRPIYRPPNFDAAIRLAGRARRAVLAGVELRRIVEEFGMSNVQAVLGAMIAQQGRRELVERRAQLRLVTTGKSKYARPIVAATTGELAPSATSDERRKEPRYRRHREAEIGALRVVHISGGL